METLKTLLRKYLKHAAIVIAIGSGVYLTVEMQEDGTIDVDITTEQTAE